MAAADILDLVIVVTLLVYVANGFMTGFIIQFARFFSIVLAFWAVRNWTEPVAQWLQFASSPSWRSILAAALVFTGVLLATGILARLLKQLVTFSLGGWIDKIFGGILAFVAGTLFWSLVLVLLFKVFPGADFLRDSRVVPYFGAVVDQIAKWLPPSIAQYVTFH